MLQKYTNILIYETLCYKKKKKKKKNQTKKTPCYKKL